MKTQLLEDIGQNAASSLTPSKIAGNSTAGQAAQNLAPAGGTQPDRPRPALGVWRQKPAGEPEIATTQQPGQAPAPGELHTLFEEIAALEAQFVPSAQQHAPALAPAPAEAEVDPEPDPELAAPPAEPLKPALPPAEATLALDQAHTAAAPQEPLFDFTAPTPALQAADPFTPAGPTRSRQRHYLWAASLLAGVLLILGGRWWYQEHTDAGSPALIAAEPQAKPQAGNVVQRQALAAKEATAEPGDGVRAAPPVPAARPSAAVPPLVMLEPDPSTAARVEQSPPPAAAPAEPRRALKPEPVAKREPASPLPNRSSRLAREQSGAPAEPATKRRRHEPVRQLARASAVGTEKPSGPDTSMAATLRACREHGYHAAQCIKRGCSVTEYGFACRGR
jgi:hypothetical protein